MSSARSLAPRYQLAAGHVDERRAPSVNSTLLAAAGQTFSRYDKVLVHSAPFAYDHRFCERREGLTYKGTQGRRVTFKIEAGEHSGDLIRSLHLVTRWPAISAAQMHPSQNVGLVHYLWGLGYACFNWVEVAIGTAFRERYTSNFMEVASELRPPTFAALRDELSAPAGARMREMVFKWDMSTPHSLAAHSGRPFELYTWLDLPFTRTPGHALPFVAMGNNTVDVTFDMASLADVVAIVPNSFAGWGSLDDTLPHTLTYETLGVDLLIGWVHLNMGEARYMAQATHHFVTRSIDTPMPVQGVDRGLRFPQDSDTLTFQYEGRQFPMTTAYFALADTNRRSLATPSLDEARFAGGVRSLMGSVVSPDSLLSLDDGCVGHPRTMSYCTDELDTVTKTIEPGFQHLVVDGVHAQVIRLHASSPDDRVVVRCLTVTVGGFSVAESLAATRTVFRVYVCRDPWRLPAAKTDWFGPGTTAFWEAPGGETDDAASDANVVDLAFHDASQMFKFGFAVDRARIGPVESLLVALVAEKQHWGVAGADALRLDAEEDLQTNVAQVFRNRMFSQYHKRGVHFNKEGTAEWVGSNLMNNGVLADGAMDTEIPLSSVQVQMTMNNDGVRYMMDTWTAAFRAATAQHIEYKLKKAATATEIWRHGLEANAVLNPEAAGGLSGDALNFFNNVNFGLLRYATPNTRNAIPYGRDNWGRYQTISSSQHSPWTSSSSVQWDNIPYTHTEAFSYFFYQCHGNNLIFDHRTKVRPIVDASKVKTDVVNLPPKTGVDNPDVGGTRETQPLFTSSPTLAVGESVRPCAVSAWFQSLTATTGAPGATTPVDAPEVSLWMYTYASAADPHADPAADNSGIVGLYDDPDKWTKVYDFDPAAFTSGQVTELLVEDIDLGASAPAIGPGASLAFAVAPSDLADSMNIDAEGSVGITAENYCTTMVTIAHNYSADVKRFCADSGTGPWLPRNRYDYRLADDAGQEVEPLKSLQIRLEGNDMWDHNKLFPGAYFRLVQNLDKFQQACTRKGLYSVTFTNSALGHDTDSTPSALDLGCFRLFEMEFVAGRVSTAANPIDLLLWFEHYDVFKVSAGKIINMFAS